MPGVFTWKPDSEYEDRLEEFYRYPSRYDRQMKTVGCGWMVFHRSKRSGRPSAYIGVGEVTDFGPDPTAIGSRLANIRNFLPFDEPVPFLNPDGDNREAVLRSLPRTSVGPHVQGNPIRPISDAEFGAIVRIGLNDIFDAGKTALLDLDDPDLLRDGIDLLRLPREAQERRMQEILLKRPVRDAAFRRNVREAYDFRCAFTGLSIRNGGNRPEVDGAHIWAVEDGGPDVVPNGIALSKTAHWMFDRELIRVNDDYSLQISDNKVPPEIKSLIGERRHQMTLPDDRTAWPSPHYLAKHRNKYLAGSL